MYLRQIFLHIYIAQITSLSGMFIFSQNTESSFRKNILKTLTFLPFYEYKPQVDPTKNSKILLDKLTAMEQIIDDQNSFDSKTTEKKRIEKKGILKKILYFTNTRRRYDSIENKISDINYIRGLTTRYESWNPEWQKKVDEAKGKISLDEIDLLKYESKRIAKKL